jgi:hypothetical protein
MIPQNQDVVLEYPGNGSTNAFLAAFPTFEDEDILVEVVVNATGQRVALDITTDYLLSNVNIPNTDATVTLVDDGQAWISGGNLATGYTLYVKFNSEVFQPSQFRSLGRYQPEALERCLDRLTLAALAIKYVADKALALPDADADVDPTFPTIAGNGGKILQAKTDETGFEFGPTAQSIYDARDDAEDAAAAALVSQSAAAASASAASTSATNSSNSATASAGSATAAAGSAVAAAASETDAEFWANLTLFDATDVITFADSPYSVDAIADRGKIFEVDDSGGNVVINMPLISATNLNWKVGFVKMLNNANTVTIQRTSPDTIEGGTSVLITTVGFGKIVYANSPTDWNASNFIAIQINDAGGGGGGLPNGGAAGSFLVKNSGLDQDAGWDNTRIPGIETDITNLEAADVALDGRLDVLEAFNAGTRLTALEAADTALDGRVGVIEAFNAGTRLTALEAVTAPGAQYRADLGFVIGDATVDGSWRMRVNAGNLEFDVRIAGVWVNKQSIEP